MKLSRACAIIPLALIAAMTWGKSPTSLIAATSPAEGKADRGFLERYGVTRQFRLGRPTAITVTRRGDAVLFLRSGPRDFVQDLFEFNVSTRRERRLLTADQILRGAEEKLSAQERAHRERKRIASRGIVSYQLSQDGRRVLVPLSGRLFVIERATGSVHELEGGSGFPLDPQISPDGERVACVRDGDLYVTDVATGRERRLTHGATTTLTHGLPEFVAEEEMGRFHGYWWSPDSRSIAYQETDVSEVEELHISDPAHPERAVDSWRYPKPGKKNAEVRLGIIAATGGVTTWVRWDHKHYPYLAVVRWKDRAPLTLLVQNRRQTEEELLAVNPVDGSTRTLLIERDRAWLNLDDEMPRWFEDGSAFLWTTERRGTWQLELRSRTGKLVRTLTDRDFRLRGFAGLDERSRVAWVLGGNEPTERHLFRVSLDRSGPPEQVTMSSGLHSAVFGERQSPWVHVFQGLKRNPTYEVADAGGQAMGSLRSVAEEPDLDLNLSFQSVGPRKLRTALVRPYDFQKGARYPVILKVYGGPLSQTVTRAADGYLIEQWLANRGFLVVLIDGRGTPARGRAWERAIKGNLIEIPLQDQVEGLRELAKLVPEMDLTRAGIYGWSFGGYFSALAVMRHPDVFRAAVAGAPVVDWRDYDTHYTERYMDLPESNPRGYEAASVLTYAGRLERPLLIAHGTVDDNVYFLHSMKLVDALFRAGKKFEFLPLAGFTHMVPDPLVTTQLHGRIAAFFEQNLKGSLESAPSPASASR